MFLEPSATSPAALTISFVVDESRFYLSLTDDLMRLFNSGAAAALMNRSSVPDDSAIESKMVSRAIASAQGQVEGRNAEIRKNILKYDDVMNRQREAIYADRRQILKGEDISNTFHSFLEETVKDVVAVNLPEGGSQDWDLEQLWVQLKQIYPINIEISEVLEAAGSRAKLTRAWLIEEAMQPSSDAAFAFFASFSTCTCTAGEMVAQFTNVRPFAPMSRLSFLFVKILSCALSSVTTVMITSLSSVTRASFVQASAPSSAASSAAPLVLMS